MQYVLPPEKVWIFAKVSKVKLHSTKLLKWDTSAKRKTERSCRPQPGRRPEVMMITSYRDAYMACTYFVGSVKHRKCRRRSREIVGIRNKSYRGNIEDFNGALNFVLSVCCVLFLHWILHVQKRWAFVDYVCKFCYEVLWDLCINLTGCYGFSLWGCLALFLLDLFHQLFSMEAKVLAKKLLRIKYRIPKNPSLSYFGS